MDQYLDQTANVDSAWELDDTVFAGRRLVAASAWSHLCSATLIVHRPYHPFGDPNN